MKNFFISLLFLILPNFDFASVGYTGSGFGNSFVNGQYCETGATLDGQPVYQNSNLYYLYSINLGGTHYWVISIGTTYPSPVADYYSSNTGAPDINTWLLDQGIAPAGTILSSTCGSPPPPPAPSGYSPDGLIITPTSTQVLPVVGFVASSTMLGGYQVTDIMWGLIFGTMIILFFIILISQLLKETVKRKK